MTSLLQTPARQAVSITSTEEAGPGAPRMLAAKVRRAVTDLELDLHERVVLTEAATGAYVVTPVIAALAGAKVFACARPSRHGSVADVVDQTRALTRELRLEDDAVTIVETVPPEVVAQSDVITNSGHLRPLGEDVLRHARADAVVPLMYEAWEERPGDVDLDYLRIRGIRVPATNERHPAVGVFDYLGELAIGQIHRAGLSLSRNRFVLLCNNPFGPWLAEALRPLCADLVVLTSVDELLARLPLLDVSGLVLALYPFDQEWVGPDQPLTSGLLADRLPGATLLRFSGHVDESSLRARGVSHFPASVQRGHMGVLMSDIGPDPVVQLQAGGLKAAELALRGETLFRGEPLLEWV